jgi:hypothetical protein
MADDAATTRDLPRAGPGALPRAPSAPLRSDAVAAARAAVSFGGCRRRVASRSGTASWIMGRHARPLDACHGEPRSVPGHRP